MRFNLLLLLLASSFVNAQKNFKPGSYTDNNGQVHTGSINFREWLKNPRNFEFTSSGNDKDAVQLYIRDVSEFEITGEDKYERKVCRISTASVLIEHLSFGIDTSYRIDTVFLKVLEKGKLNLYAFIDELKQRFYLSTADHPQPYELIYNVYQDVEKELKINEDKGYIAQLISAGVPFTRIPKITSKINAARYDETDLSKVVHIINSEGHNIRSAASKPTLHLRIGSGASMASMKFMGDRAPILATSEYDFNSSISPLLYAGLNLYLHPATSKLFLLTDFSYASYKHTGNAKKSTIQYDYTYKFDLDYSSLVACLGLAYNFVKTEQLEVYFSAGPAAQFINVTKNNEHGTRVSTIMPQTKDDYDLDKLSTESSAFGLYLRAGIAISNKLDIAINFRSQQGNIFTYNYFQNGASYVDLRVGYKFKATKK